MSRRALFIILLTAATAVLVGCGSAAPAETVNTAASTEAAATSAPTAAAAAVENPGRLTIYSGRSESLVQPIIEQFETATGIDVEVRYGSTPEITSVLLEEGANSPADVFYAQDPGGLGAVQAAGLLQPLPESVLSGVPARFRAADNSWAGISGRARVVVYNTDAITDPASELPADIYDFIDPRWNGRLGWAPTNASFQAMVTAMRTIWGEEKTRAWLEGIQANNPMVFEGNAPLVQAVAAGEIDAGFVNHYYLYRFLAEQGEGFGARNYFLPGGGPGSLIMVSGAGVLKSADNADNARRFVEFMLSLPAQQYFASQTFEYPVIDGVAVPASLPPLADLDAIAPDLSLDQLADVAGTQQMLIDLGIIE